MAIKTDELLEVFAEALRQARRSYVKPLDLSSVVINNEEELLEVKILDGTKTRIFYLELSEEVEAE